MDHIDTSTVIELRQYTLRPGRREELIELFDSTFIESQEATGMRVLGQFRDHEDPDRFVWLRGFDGMRARRESLQSFYGGPVWQANRERANETMIDSDDVLLLRPVTKDSGLPQTRERPAINGTQRTASVVLATIYLLTNPVDARFREFFDRDIAPVMAQTGAAPVARYETETAENDFPRLPVRAGEHAYVWFATFPDHAALRAHRARLDTHAAWRTAVAPALDRLLAAPATERVLEPTSRSQFRHVEPFEYTRDRQGSRQDFDFIAGEWNVLNHRLRDRGVGCNEWETFPATHRGGLYLDGIANVDEMTMPEPRGKGMTLRTFDLARRQWSIYWISSKDGLLQPPVHGGFSGNQGVFYGEDRDGARPVKVRFIWTVLDAREARWEQAFSYDDASWETNWVMEFTRAGHADAVSDR